jgi:hypothetical protein
MESWYHHVRVQDNEGVNVVVLGFDNRHSGASRAFPAIRVEGDGSGKYPYIVDIQGEEHSDRFCAWYPNIAHTYGNMEFTILFGLTDEQVTEFHTRMTAQS